MSVSIQTLIDRYLDELLTDQEFQTLQEWLMESSANAERFAEAMLLHDRLHGELQTLQEEPISTSPETRWEAVLNRQTERSTTRWAVSILAVAVMGLLGFYWYGAGSNSVAAASVELNRVIAASIECTDRSYAITVDEVMPTGKRGLEKARNEPARPAKPPMEGAKLHVRKGHQFVLERITDEGEPFITGSNGETSWAVSPDGPVRVSRDLNRFNRDLPGHEHAMPLSHLDTGLLRLREAYDVGVMRCEKAPGDASHASGEKGLLIAVKRKGYRGPERVEILYWIPSGKFEEIRFVEMPYGPQRLNLRLTLIDENPLPNGYFDHDFHHSPERPVAFENE